MTKPVETDPARPDAPAPIVLVPKPPRPAPAKSHTGRRWLIAGSLVLVLIAAAGATWWYTGSGGTVRYTTAAVTRGNVTRAVTATGTVNPVLTIIVGHLRVRASMQDVTCDYNTEVKKGQVCAKIDPRPYQSVVNQNKANLDVAKAQLEKDKATLTYAKQIYDRNVRLAATNAISKDALDNAKSALDQARAQVGVDQATIEQRQAQLEAAQINLGYTNIVSPVDGTVVSRNVTIGQTVAASFQTPTLFLIATDLTKMQVDTNVSESDIGGIKDGDKALFTVDAFPNRTFQGTVSQVRQSPQNVQNVVTYDVVVQRRQSRPRAQARHDRGQPHRHRRARQRAARAEPGAALFAGGARRRARRRGITAQPGASETRPGQVYVLRDGKPVAVPVTAGLDDDSFTEIVKGDLKPGERVITTEQRNGQRQQPVSLGAAPAASRAAGPIMAEPIIKLEHVTRTYHVGDVDVHALNDVSLAIEAGEFVAIMGHSGSGKSTLMAILGCLDRPSSGRYFFEGTDVAGLEEPERAQLRSERLGFVFQSFNLLARTSALENVALPLFYTASGPASAVSRTERAREALELLGLGDRERNTPGQLSGGQQQRVAIARALINSPGLLLADEPTGNLDTRTSHEIMETLTKLNREQGVTIVVVTHEADIAAYADRVLTMRDGQVISDKRNPKPAKTAPGVRAAGESVALPHAKAATAPRRNAAWAFGLMIMAAAVQAIRRNMMRSALTMLGVFIGVAALIAMVAVGQGANEAVRKQIERLGTNLVVVLPGAHRMGGMRGGSGSASTLTVTDAQAILHESPVVSEVSYLIRQGGQVQAGNQNWSTQIQGVSPNYPPMTNWRVDGRPRDHAGRRRVRRAGRRYRRDSVAQAVRRIANPDRRADPGEGRADAGDRHSGIEGTDTLGAGSGRLRDDPVHHRGAESSRGGLAQPDADAAQLDLSEPAQPLRPDAASRRLRQPDFRAGQQPGGRAARHHPGDRNPQTAPPHQARRRGRFFGAQSQPDRRDRGKLEPHHGAAARRRRLDLAGGGRHRHHEHPAGVGDRAHARDRPAHGDRRAAPARAAAVPRRGGVPQRDRRRRRHHHGRRLLCDHRHGGGLVDADLGHGHCRRLPVLRRGRHLLRLLPGAQSGAPRSDRGAALRVSGLTIPAACAARRRRGG